MPAFPELAEIPSLLHPTPLPLCMVATDSAEHFAALRLPRTS
ncbi:hypothetical protein CHELA40_14765 [Chelatococcus asaccharovorans]|nr:hypothetical protein CHELA17_60856 [Chelatococcus asaccharovorans]CAH1679821.1 hypothetical protein CHELA40_14765 [Chelatococcus asaccharovorans]